MGAAGQQGELGSGSSLTASLRGGSENRDGLEGGDERAELDAVEEEEKEAEAEEREVKRQEEEEEEEEEEEDEEEEEQHPLKEASRYLTERCLKTADVVDAVMLIIVNAGVYTHKHAHTHLHTRPRAYAGKHTRIHIYICIFNSRLCLLTYTSTVWWLRFEIRSLWWTTLCVCMHAPSRSALASMKE
jgi:hypothetical protein